MRNSPSPNGTLARIVVDSASHRSAAEKSDDEGHSTVEYELGIYEAMQHCLQI